MRFFIIAQICAIINFITYGLSIWMKNKKDILAFQIICNIADITQYLCLNAYTACAINTISLLRNIFFRKTTGKINILFLILILYWICGMATYDNLFSMMSIIIVSIQTLLAYQNKEQYIRIGAIFIIIYWIVYDFIYGAYVAAFLDCFIFTSNVLSVIHYSKKQKKEGEKCTDI